MTLKISSKLSLPDDAARWTFGCLAIKGAGKTYGACVLAEEMIHSGIPIVALDPLGVWWGLRVGINNHEGLPVVVFGGRHKDLAIPTQMDKGREVVDESRLKLMVKAILESRMSAVIDTSDFSKGMSRRIVAIFVSELYRLNQDYGVRHVFLEEADEWVPQRQRSGDAWGSAAFGAVDDLVRKGGNFLLGCTLITQRSAVLNKDVLTQINCLIVLRILHKLDKEAVKTWVESVAHPDDPRIKKWYDSLRDLKNGEAWVWHPEDPDLFERIQFRQRETLHATREYFTRSKFEQKDMVMVPVEVFVSKFKNVFEPKPKIVEVRKEYMGSLTDLGVAVSPFPQRKAPLPIPQLTGVYDSTSLEVVNQSLPNLEIRQFKPNLSIPVETLDAPTNPIGRVAVILKNFEGRQDRWTNKSVKEAIRTHAWDDNGVDEAIDQLLRWEILKRQSNNYLKFYPDRVQVVESKAMIPA